jgi:hypothetical protein
MNEIPDDKSDKPPATTSADRGDTSTALEKQVQSRGQVDQARPGDSRENSSAESAEPSRSQRFANGAERMAAGAKMIAGVLSEHTVETASKVAGAVEKIATNAHVPDSVARTFTKGIDAVQKELLAVAKSDTARHVFGVVEKVEKAAAIGEGLKRYREAREGGLGRPGAGVDAVVGAAGGLVGKDLGKAFEFVVDGSARGLGIAVDTASAWIRGDQQHLEKLSDSFASAKLGSLAFYSDVGGDFAVTGDPSKVVSRVSDAAADGKLGSMGFYGDVGGDFLATGDMSKAVSRVTDAAADGKLGWPGGLGDWLADYAWTLKHRSK